MSPFMRGTRMRPLTPTFPKKENDMTSPNAGDLVKTGGAAILASLVRTLVPLIVGLVVAGFTKLGVPVDDESVALVINGAVSAAVAFGYYAVARGLEVFASTKFGWLLGYAKAPVYVADDNATARGKKA